MSLEKTVGTAIRELRRKKNLTQQQLGDALGCTREAVTSWEIGKCFPSFYTVAKLGEILGLKVDPILKQANISAH